MTIRGAVNKQRLHTVRRDAGYLRVDYWADPELAPLLKALTNRDGISRPYREILDRIVKQWSGGREVDALQRKLWS